MSQLAKIQSPEDTTEHVGSHRMFLRHRPRKSLQSAHDQRKTRIHFWLVPGKHPVVPSDGGYLARDSPMLVSRFLRVPAVEEELHREVTELQCILRWPRSGQQSWYFH